MRAYVVRGADQLRVRHALAARGGAQLERVACQRQLDTRIRPALHQEKRAAQRLAIRLSVGVARRHFVRHVRKTI